MSRNAVNFVLDIVLLLTFAVLLSVSVMIEAVFPPGTQAGGWRVWRLGYDAWRDVQLAALAAFTLGIVVHLILHWTWVCGFVAARVSEKLGRRVTSNESTRTLYGVIVLMTVLTLLGLFTMAADFSAKAPKSP